MPISEPMGSPSKHEDAALAVKLERVSYRYGAVRALDQVNWSVRGGSRVGLIGPDGVGKSTLLALMSGSRAFQSGQIEVLGQNMTLKRERVKVCPRLAYLPQGLGRHLYPALSVGENIDFFGRLFGLARKERQARREALLQATGLAAFVDRPVGQLSGGMKQKLGLCCALIHDPELLILDEPTTGVDPLSRRHFWALLDHVHQKRPWMTVVVATAYMDEAMRFDDLLALQGGRVLAQGPPDKLLQASGASTFEQAFMQWMVKQEGPSSEQPASVQGAWTAQSVIAIEARGLTRRFGDFTAVDGADFSIRQGEIFGFVGSNGCGKTTVMKMLTGLLPPTEGEALLFGQKMNPHDLESRRKVGFMTQSFSLYHELSVKQNLWLHAHLFDVPKPLAQSRIAQLSQSLGLEEVLNRLPPSLPLGLKQRLSLAVALIHQPPMLILDEPSSGVDPLAREAFWQIMLNLSRREGVTLFVSTHHMSEAERCDRVALMHAGRVLVTDTPQAIKARQGGGTLEDAFVTLLESADPSLALGRDALAACRTWGVKNENQPQPGQFLPGLQAHSSAMGQKDGEKSAVAADLQPTTPKSDRLPEAFSGSSASKVSATPRLSATRLLSYAWRESLDLRRDPVRQALAVLGSVILMLVLAYGISMDVDSLPFAVLDLDQTPASRNYIESLAGSTYFEQRAPIQDEASMDQRLRSGELGLAMEIPPGFAHDLKRGAPVEIGAWIDGSMPIRAEIIQAYVQGIHADWLATRAREISGHDEGGKGFQLETRFRYNPEVRSLPAMAPAVLPLLLILIPAILTAMSVVREKELGSIVNFHVTPVTKLEFLLGKQLPYVVLAMGNFVLLTAMIVGAFAVPMKGSWLALLVAAGLYVMASTALGLLISAFMTSQLAALFGTAVLTILPTMQFSGMIHPVSSLEGPGSWIGHALPTTHFLIIVRGTFLKGLGFAELQGAFMPLCMAPIVLMGLAVLCARKQTH